jgi:hypothetical protein
MMTRYSKTIVALLGALATWGVTAAEDNTYTQVELWGALLALATAAGVYAFPNRPPAGEPSDPLISEQGHGTVELVTCVACVVSAVVLLAWAFETGPFS